MNNHRSFLRIRAALAGLAMLLLCWAPGHAEAPAGGSWAADSAGFLTPAIGAEGAPDANGSAYPHPCAAKKLADPPLLFTFATIGDSHIRYTGGSDTRYLKDEEDAKALLGNYVHDINAHFPRVDFAVHLGDVTDYGMLTEFQIARQVMDSLTCPLRPVLGNHDNFQSDHKQGWLGFAGIPSANYTFDVEGFHFVVIDCTLDPYAYPYVDCDLALRNWVAGDLAANPGKPTIVLSHFNMWERPWDAMFDTTMVYSEYRGMPELRQVLESSGCVIAVINGHVHANRVEVHNGIHYIDVGATLVGPPSIRYFYVYPNRIEVAYAYISNATLFSRVTALCPLCLKCFDPSKVCAFIDGQDRDKRFVIPVGALGGSSVPPPAAIARARPVLAVSRDVAGHVHARMSSDLTGLVDMSLNDVLGRRLARCDLWKSEPEADVDLTDVMPALSRLPAGVYFVRAELVGTVATAKLVVLP